MPSIAPMRLRALSLALLLSAAPAIAANKPKVPEGFEVRLVATVPAVQYPCQVATAPGNLLFVAEDPMDQVGPYESNNGRILKFKDETDPVEFAKGFRAIQGMVWRDGELYVCHMPFLTIIKDTDGDGKADARRDLFKDLGPTNNQGLNDHIVSGIQFGIDGYLYISVGDKGIPKATGTDGRTIQIKGGGCVRCRPDGTGIEVVSTGTRNHLEVNLDPLDNIFTYDNTDDGLGWWTRVTHHIDGGYYGYAYDYLTRPDRFLNRMAEYGGGSPCGAILYKEEAWPAKWQGMGYWAEWGKGKVQAIRFKPKGASFEVAEMIDFAVPDGVDNFRPIDLAISHDGRTMYVADWGMGGWGSKTEKVGRVWAITPKEKVETLHRGKDSDSIAELIKSLEHPAHAERMRAQSALAKSGPDSLGTLNAALADPNGNLTARVHILWSIDAMAGGTPEATMPIMEALSASAPELRAQAARALGVRGVALAAAVAKLADLVSDSDPTVRLQALIALGRIGAPGPIPAIASVVADPDPYVAFASRIALRRIGDWSRTAEVLKASSDPKIRLGILSAMDEQYDPGAAAALISYAMSPDHPSIERAAAFQYLSSITKKAKPWNGSWWGTRPAAGEPPAKTIAWEATPAILETLHLALADKENSVRVAGIAAVKEAKDFDAAPILRARFGTETDDEVRKQIALVLGDLKDKASLPILASALKDQTSAEVVREAALSAVEAIGTEAGAAALVDLLKGDIAADRQPRILAALGKFHATASLPAIGEKLGSAEPKVRAAAADAVGKFRSVEAVLPKLRSMTTDSDLAARKAAISALGLVKDRDSVPALISLSENEDTRFESMTALANIPDVRALQVYLRGLADKNADLRNASASAVAAIRDKAAPVLEELAKRHELPAAALPELTKVFTGLQPITSWKVIGPLPIDDKIPFAVDAIDFKSSLHGADGKPRPWRVVKAIDKQGQVNLGDVLRTTSDDLAAFGYAEITSKVARKAPFAVGSDDTLTVWVNGKVAFDFQDRSGFQAEARRFEADLVEGTNRILIKCGNRGGGWQYSVAVAPSEYAFLKAPASAAFDPEAYSQFALKSGGSAEKGKALFMDPKGLACVKCHALKGEGGAVGPDLSDLGVKYPKAEIIASVLYPSAKIFSGYEPVSVALNDGRVLTGIIKSDTPESLEIVDAEAKTIKIPKDDIDEKKVSNISLMPNGLAEGLSKEDFADLISFLETLKDKPPAKP